MQRALLNYETVFPRPEGAAQYNAQSKTSSKEPSFSSSTSPITLLSFPFKTYLIMGWNKLPLQGGVVSKNYIPDLRTSDLKPRLTQQNTTRPAEMFVVGPKANCLLRARCKQSNKSSPSVQAESLA